MHLWKKVSVKWRIDRDRVLKKSHYWDTHKKYTQTNNASLRLNGCGKFKWNVISVMYVYKMSTSVRFRLCRISKSVLIWLIFSKHLSRFTWMQLNRWKDVVIGCQQHHHHRHRHHQNMSLKLVFCLTNVIFCCIVSIWAIQPLPSTESCEKHYSQLCST